MKLARRATEWAAVTVASVPLGLVYSIMLARALGPGSRGEYATFVTSVSTIVGVMSLGIGIVGRAEVAGDQTRTQAVNSNLAWFSIVVGFALILLAAGFAVFVPDSPLVWIAFPLAVCAAAAIYSSYGILLLQGLGAFRRVNALRLGRLAIDIAVVGSFVVLAKFGVRGAVWGWTTATLITATLTFLVLWRLNGPPTAFQIDEFKTAVKHGWRVLVAGQSIALQTSIVIFLLNRYETSVDIGLFAIALGLSAQVSSLCSTLAVVASDRIAGPHRNASEDVVKRLTRFLVAVAAPLFLIAAVFSTPVIVSLYGDAYRPSAFLFVILLIGHLISQVTEVDSQFLIGQHWRTTDAMLLNIFNMALAVSLAFVLIPRYGVVGGAISLSGAYVLNAVMHHIWIRRLMGCPWPELLVLTRSDVDRIISALNLRTRAAES
jgi:O-antigen/teichoic acid export membrane protein